MQGPPALTPPPPCGRAPWMSSWRGPRCPCGLACMHAWYALEQRVTPLWLVPNQASAAELRSALRQRGAVELDGAWRLVSRAYLGTLLDMLLLSAAQHGWELSAIPVADACSVMEADGFHPA